MNVLCALRLEEIVNWISNPWNYFSPSKCFLDRLNIFERRINSDISIELIG